MRGAAEHVGLELAEPRLQGADLYADRVWELAAGAGEVGSRLSLDLAL